MASRSRRDFLGLVVPTVFALRNGYGQIQEPLGRTRALALRLDREYRGAFLLACSPDGRRVCFYGGSFITTYSVSRFFRNLTRSRDENSISIVDLPSGQIVFRRPLPAGVLNASFAADGEHLYAAIASYRVDGQASQQLWITIPQGRVEELPIGDEGISHWALGDGISLGTIYSDERISALALSALPNFTEIARVPFASEGGREKLGRDTGPRISADRKTIAYASDHWIVCHNAGDLSLRWKKSFEHECYTAWKLATTADGRRVAAAIIDTAFIVQQRKFYIGIYDGRDGTEVARLPVNGFEGIALSADGNILAVGQKVGNQRTKEIEATIRLYDIATGREIATAIHDRIPNGRLQALAADFLLEFTSDSKYLISSGANTKVWTLDR